MAKDTRSRSWLVTQSADKINFDDLQLALADYTWVGQLEQGKDGGEQGYKHYQIYIENKNPIKFSTLKKRLPNAHIEPRNGTRQQAYDYVTKEDTRIDGPYSQGIINLEEQQGKRTDIDTMLTLLEDGATPMEIYAAYPKIYFIHKRKIEELYFDRIREEYRRKRRDVEVIYIYGSTGCGKTSYVLNKYGDENVYIFGDYPAGHSEKEKFDDYRGEDVILFDEFRSGIAFSRMLRYTDIYHVDLPARYATKVATYTKIYIVSNWSLDMQYPNIKEQYPQDYAAFLRRITHVYNFDVSKQFPVMKRGKQIGMQVISGKELSIDWGIDEDKLS